MKIENWSGTPIGSILFTSRCMTNVLYGNDGRQRYETDNKRKEINGNTMGKGKTEKLERRRALNM